MSIRSEREVIGLIAENKFSYPSIEGILEPEMFTDPLCRECFEVIEKLGMENKPIDLPLLAVMIGKDVVMDLSMMAMSCTGRIDSHAYLIYEAYLRRQLIELGEELKKSDNQMDVYEQITQVRAKIEALEGGRVENSIVSADQVTMQINSHDNGKGVQSGSHRINKILGGYKPGKLYVIAGRPGMGKTSFMMSEAFAITNEGVPVGIFSLEVPNEELHNKIRSYQSGVPAFVIDNGNCNERQSEDLRRTDQSNTGRKLIYDSELSLSVMDLRRKIRKMVAAGAQLVFIDYLQLMRPSDRYKGDKTREIGEISEACKRAAREFDIPVIALAQLNRSVETRGGDKIPILSDLRDSGNIEQDADLIAFMYRPEYYNMVGQTDYDDWGLTGVELDGTASFIVSKHRGGKLSNIPLHFDKNKTLFTDYSFDDSALIGKAISQPIKPNYITEDVPF